MFGALVAAVAKGGELEAEPAAVLPEDGDVEQTDATAEMPPPFVVREWLAQSETPPSLPKGLIAGLEKFESKHQQAVSDDDQTESSELVDGETMEPSALPALDTGGQASQANDGAPSVESKEQSLRPDLPKLPAQTSDSPEQSLAASVIARPAVKTAPAATPVNLVQYFAGASWTAPHTAMGNKTGDIVKSAAVREQPVGRDLKLQLPTGSALSTTDSVSSAPSQLPTDSSPEFKPSVRDPVDEAAPHTQNAPKAPHEAERAKAPKAAVPPGGVATADPISQPSIHAQPDTPASSSDGVITPLRSANASSATDGSADAPVRLAPSARNEQSPEMQALALHIAARSARGDSRFTIRLDPPELGRIDVNLSMNSHGHAQAVLAVEKPQTLDLLQRDASGLERALKDAGLELGSNLSFSLKEEGRPAFARDDHHQGSPGRTIEIVPSDKANAIAALNVSLLDHLYGSRTTRLDITV